MGDDLTAGALGDLDDQLKLLLSEVDTRMQYQEGAGYAPSIISGPATMMLRERLALAPPSGQPGQIHSLRERARSERGGLIEAVPMSAQAARRA